MNSADSTQIRAAGAKCAAAWGALAGGVKAKRRALWPAEVRDKGKHVFIRPHTLRHEGGDYRLEIRSRAGRGVWILIDGRVVVFGKTEPEALAAAVMAIDLDVDVVLDQRGRRLA